MEFQAVTRKDWHAWLRKNHSNVNEVWLIFFKKHTGKPSITYAESLEEAICFGWIDGLKKRIDDERYTYRFTPRKSNSKWSPRNIKIAQKMIADGKMTKAGLDAFNRGTTYSNDIIEAREAVAVEFSPGIKKELQKYKKAWANFQKLAPGHKKQYVLWLNSAKRKETLDKRLQEAISLLNKNEKLGLR